MVIESLSVEDAELVGYVITAEHGIVGTAMYRSHACLFAASWNMLAVIEAFLAEEWRVGELPERRPLLEAAAFAVEKAKRGM